MQMPSFANISETAQSYSVMYNANFENQEFVWLMAAYLTILIDMLIHPVLAERIKPNEKGKKPKVILPILGIPYIHNSYIAIHNKHMFELKMFAVVLIILSYDIYTIISFSKNRALSYFVSTFIFTFFLSSYSLLWPPLLFSYSISILCTP